MKKALAVLLVLSVLFALSACGSSEPPAPTPVNSGDDFIEVAASIPFLLTRLSTPESMEIYSDIDVIELYDGLKVFCFTFGADYVPGVYTKAVEAEIYTDGKNCLVCWENEESFIGWRDSIAELAAEGYSIKTIDGKQIAKNWGINFLSLEDVEENTVVPSDDLANDTIVSEDIIADDTAESSPIIPGPVNNNSFESSAGPLVLKEYAYYESLGASNVIAIMENSGDKIILYPQLNAKVLDSSGAMVGAGDCFGGPIYPGQTVAFSLYACEAPAGAVAVECTPMLPQDYALGVYPSEMYPEYEQIQVENDYVFSDRVVCDVINPNNYNIDFFHVTVVFRDEVGAICGGYTEYGTALPANSSIGFEIYAWDNITYSSYELYANIG